MMLRARWVTLRARWVTQTLQDPILLLPWVCFRGGGFPKLNAFALLCQVVPKTVANFVALCKGDQTSAAGTTLAYKGSAFHRVIPEFMCQV
jgi:hypothetical protein